MKRELWIIIVAGGAGSRMAAVRGGADRSGLVPETGVSDPFADIPKQYRPLGGKPLLRWSLDAFAAVGDPGRIVLVVPAQDEARASALCDDLPVPPIITTGGVSRQESVAKGLAAIPADRGWVAVHDAARPFFDCSVLPDWLARMESMGDEAALLPVLPAVDSTVKIAGGRVERLLDRASLARVQTPQLFDLGLLRRAHRSALKRGEKNAGDDGALVFALGVKPAVMPGDHRNYKITTAEDLERAEMLLAVAENADTHSELEKEGAMRSGLGYDSHRFDPERPLILGGVKVPSEVGGLAGHSDADALTHAVIDAILGAAALGDIGSHFPDDDPAWKDADSLDLLRRVVVSVAELGLRPAQVDVTVITEEPKLRPHMDAIRASLGAALGLPPERVSVKAKTNEGMGAIGRGEGLAAMALAVLEEV